MSQTVQKSIQLLPYCCKPCITNHNKNIYQFAIRLVIKTQRRLGALGRVVTFLYSHFFSHSLKVK